MKLQLPDDVKLVGYKKTSRFAFEQVYFSNLHNFTGTEKEFLANALAYEYVERNKHTRGV